MKFRCGLCSLQIFNAIPLRFSRRLRNSPRPWVRHTQRPTTSDSLENPHQKAKSSMSLQPHQNFIRASSLGGKSFFQGKAVKRIRFDW